MARKITNAAEIKTRVVAFRVTDDQWEALEKKLTSPAVVGVNSVGMYAYKATFDLLAGHTVHTDPVKAGRHPDCYQDAEAKPEAVKSTPAPARRGKK